MKGQGSADSVTRLGLQVIAAATMGITLLVLSYLALESGPALAAIGPVRFLSDLAWRPTADQFNLMPMLAGSLVVASGAILLATPFALASAIFGRFYLEGLVARGFRRLLETLSGIPSVLFGLWGLNVLVPLIAGWAPPGQSVLAGVIVLALMILPTIALLADNAFAAVPEGQLRAGAAAGLSRWAIVRGIAIPGARSGIGVGILLGTGRALGETVAVVMVMGNVVSIPASVFEPARTLTANIALEMAYASAEHRSALFVSGLVLAVMALVLVWVADRFGSVDRPAERGRYGL